MKKNKIWGIALVLLAIFYGASQFIPSLPSLSLLKVIITIWLITIIIQNIPKLNFGSVLIPGGIIILLFKQELVHMLGLENGISGFVIITASIIASIGLNMIFADTKRKKRIDNMKKYKDNKTYFYSSSDDIIDGVGKFVNNDSNNGQDVNEDTVYQQDVVQSNVTFSSATKYINSNDFKKGDFECNFGELKVYFDKATILGDRADVKIECNFGSIILYVPRNWKVSSNVELVGAGIKERGEHMGDGPILYVSGEANFARVVIKYV